MRKQTKKKQADHWRVPRLWTRFQKCLLHPWGPNGQMTQMLHIYGPKQFQRTRFGVNRSSGRGVSKSARYQEPFSRPWTCPLCPHVQMTLTLHIYRLRWFQWTWFHINRPSSCWVPTSARFQEPLSRKWACPLCPHGQMTMTLHIYGLRRFQWAWCFF